MPGGEFDHHSPDLQPVASMAAPKSHKLEIMSKSMYSILTHESVYSAALFLINTDTFLVPLTLMSAPNCPCQSQQGPAPFSRHMRMYGNA